MVFGGCKLDSQVCYVVWDKTFALSDYHFLSYKVEIM